MWVWFLKVLDEADRLLEVSFEADLDVIFSNIPRERQTLLFSATLTDSMNRLKQLSTKKLHCWTAPIELVRLYILYIHMAFQLLPT